MNEQPTNYSAVTGQPQQLQNQQPVAPATQLTQSIQTPTVRVGSVPHQEPETTVVQETVEQMFAPINTTEPAKELDIDKIIAEQTAAIDAGKSDVINGDKTPIPIPLSEKDQMDKYYQREIIANLANINEVIRDMTSSVQSIGNTTQFFTANANLLKEALKRVVTRKDPEEKHPEHIKEALQPTCPKVAEGLANPFAMYRGKTEVVIEGPQGVAAMEALTGGMRRVILWNSGFHILLRRLNLTQLNAFYREMNHEDYEYGKEFGMFYYLFADINIVRYIVENLLPIAIAGSNYAHWKDTEKMIQQISDQDLHVILWAMGLMLHPRGASVNFVCAEEGCGYIHNETVDLSKLRLINQDLITEEMLDYFRRSGSRTDKDLEDFRKLVNLDGELKFEVGTGLDKKIWTVHTKQANLFDKRAVGLDYLSELRKQCSLTNPTDVHMNIIYNLNRCFKPWIKSISLTVPDESGNPFTAITHNDGTEEKDKIIFGLLDDFQQYVPDFADKMKEYILDTKIQHICFYFPECPKCHTEPKTSYQGYIPYDPMHAFFTLALMKLLQGASTHDTPNT